MTLEGMFDEIGAIIEEAAMEQRDITDAELEHANRLIRNETKYFRKLEDS